MDKCRNFIEKDAFAHHCGVTLVEAGDGVAKTQLRVGPEHLNSVGIVHGAAVFTLADTAFAVAANSHDHEAVAVNVNIAYLKAARQGVLTAEARERNRDGKIGSYLITVTDETGRIIAVFEGLAYRKLGRK